MWVLSASGAALDGHKIGSDGNNRYASDNFKAIMDTLQFSEATKNIYKENGQYRFNALKNPAAFLEEMGNFEKSIDVRRGGKIDKFCDGQIWNEKYGDLKKLLRLWIKNQKDNVINKKIDYEKYRKTLDILTDLIPIVSAAGIVKTVEEYEMEKEIVEKDLYNYYKKETIGYPDGYLQKCMEGNRLVENFENVMDRIHQGNFTKMQKDLLMDWFLVENINPFYDSCEWILGAIENFQKRCNVWGASNEDYGRYQDIWNQTIRYMEECP